MAMIAYKCPEIQVVVVDINQARNTFAVTSGAACVLFACAYHTLELLCQATLLVFLFCVLASRGLCKSTCWMSPLCRYGRLCLPVAQLAMPAGSSLTHSGWRQKVAVLQAEALKLG